MHCNKVEPVSKLVVRRATRRAARGPGPANSQRYWRRMWSAIAGLRAPTRAAIPAPSGKFGRMFDRHADLVAWFSRRRGHPARRRNLSAHPFIHDPSETW
jgi:hypothetical protein